MCMTKQTIQLNGKTAVDLWIFFFHSSFWFNTCTTLMLYMGNPPLSCDTELNALLILTECSNAALMLRIKMYCLCK